MPKIGEPIKCATCDGTGEVFNVKEYDESHWRECEECDGFGVEVTPGSRRCYFALVQASKSIGWPSSYREDLTVHDRNLCNKIGPDTPVAWIVRESGTHMVVPGPNPIDGAGNTAHGFIRSCFGSPSGIGNCRFYAWDGDHLRELANAEALAVWAESVARSNRFTKVETQIST